MSSTVNSRNNIRTRTPEDVRNIAKNGANAVLYLGASAIGLAAIANSAGASPVFNIALFAGTTAAGVVCGASIHSGIQTAASTYIDPDAETNTPASTETPTAAKQD